MFSIDQYKAAKAAAVLIDRSSQGKIALTGADRRAFLHALLTNDIAGLAAGTGCYAAYLTPQGRMITDMRVIETGTRILLDVEGEVAAALAARLDSLIFSEDAQARDVTGELWELGVHGPLAASVLERITGVPAASFQAMAQYANVPAQRIQAGTDLLVVRDDGFGVPGFDIYVPASNHAAHVASAVLDAGAVECEAETADTLRIEAGRPRFGVDMNTDTIPLEAGLEDRAISLTKGCYVGQEVIIRVLHRGHGRVAKRLVGLVLASNRVPLAGDAILSGDQEIGRITSAARSPAMNAAIALGYVSRDASTEGTRLAVKSDDELLDATVHQLHQ